MQEPQSYPLESIQLKAEDKNIELAPRHNQIARMYAFGFSQREISERLGMGQAHLSIICNTPLFKQVVKEMQGKMNEGLVTAQNILMEASPKAAEILVEVLENVGSPAGIEMSPRMAKEVALDVLRSSGAAKTADSGPKIIVEINEKKMELIFTTLKELR